MASQAESLSISNVINNIVGVIGRNPVIFIGLSLIIVGIPQLLIGLFVANPENAVDMMNVMNSPGAIIGGAAGYLVFLVVSVVLQASLIVATTKDLAGQAVDFGSCINQALGKLLPLIGLGIVVSIGVMIGFVLLIVPGVILYLMWMVATPALVVEDKGVFDAMSRSSELTSGSKWKLLGLIVVLIIFSFIIGIPFGLLAFMGPTVAMVGNAAASAISAAVSSAGVASVYVELRRLKDGTDVGSLADVFA